MRRETASPVTFPPFIPRNFARGARRATVLRTTVIDQGPERRYANYFEMGFTAHEVFIDMGQQDPQSETVLHHTHIVTTPSSAKAFHEMLGGVLDRYERSVKPIAGHEEGRE